MLDGETFRLLFSQLPARSVFLSRYFCLFWPVVIRKCFLNLSARPEDTAKSGLPLEEENGSSISIMGAPPSICRGHTQVISHSFSIPQQF